ncbi:hypothetical protein [Hymenobacter antarcticus]|uniref:Secreted protein n=1 Tax=Hymenobacter antarcticus TaxID=486270 RepID=A0ABP7PCL5_9BACT
MLPLRLLFRSFALLLGLLYLGGVCELDAAEARQHYAHESHDYITTAPTAEVPAPIPQPDAPAVVLVAGPGPARPPVRLSSGNAAGSAPGPGWPTRRRRCAGSTCATPYCKSDLRV